jgi:hypothetical protein
MIARAIFAPCLLSHGQPIWIVKLPFEWLTDRLSFRKVPR